MVGSTIFFWALLAQPAGGVRGVPRRWSSEGNPLGSLHTVGLEALYLVHDVGESSEANLGLQCLYNV